MNVKGTKKKNQVVTANIFEQQKLLKKAEGFYGRKEVAERDNVKKRWSIYRAVYVSWRKIHSIQG